MPVPQLPIEIWSRIVSFKCLQDHLKPQVGAESWLQLRRVYRTFRSAVETHNIDRYLRHTSINTSISYQVADQYATFHFVGFDEKNSRLAVLQTKEEIECQIGGDRTTEARKIRREAEAEEQTFRVQRIVGLRSNAYEIPLIHMEIRIDLETESAIKFDWRATFSGWWAEREFLANDRQRNVESNIAFAEDVTSPPEWSVGIGEEEWKRMHTANLSLLIHRYEAFRKITERCEAQRLDAFKNVRRKRVIRLLQRMDNARLDEEDVIAKRHLSIIGEEAAITGRLYAQRVYKAQFDKSDESDDEWEEEWMHRFDPFTE